MTIETSSPRNWVRNLFGNKGNGNERPLSDEERLAQVWTDEIGKKIKLADEKGLPKRFVEQKAKDALRFTIVEEEGFKMVFIDRVGEDVKDARMAIVVGEAGIHCAGTSPKEPGEMQPDPHNWIVGKDTEKGQVLDDVLPIFKGAVTSEHVTWGVRLPDTMLVLDVVKAAKKGLDKPYTPPARY